MPTLRSQVKRGSVLMEDGTIRAISRSLRIDTTQSDENGSPAKKQKVVSDNEAILGPSILCSTPEFPKPMLQRALSNPSLEAEQWLSASVMNLILTRIAEKHPHIAYFSEQFAFLKLSTEDFDILEDIMGRKVQKLENVTQFVWLINNGNVHWSLARALLHPKRQLQLFDPLGNISRRKTPSNRQIPRNIINWLNATFPCKDEDDTWQLHAIHAVTSSHQKNSYDCGVACLLYAEKCGESQTREEINEGTTQEEITRYRHEIQSVVTEVTSSIVKERHQSLKSTKSRSRS